MNRNKAPLAICLLTITLASGCAADPPNKDEATQSSTAPIPYPEQAFAEPTWATTAPQADDPYLATTSTYAYLHDGTLHGLDSTGQQKWEQPIPAFAGEGQESTEQPQIRPLDEKTIAVITAGTRSGEELAASTFDHRVTVIDTQSGKLIGNQDVEGERELVDFGVGFKSSDSDTPAVIVTADAKTKSVPPRQANLLGGKVASRLTASIGGQPIMELSPAKVESGSILEKPKTTARTKLQSGFAGDGWNSVETKPSGAPSAKANLAVADSRYILGWWANTDTDPTTKTFGIIDPQEGNLLGTAACGPTWDGRQIAASPNGNYRVIKNLWFSSSGATECYGGGEDEKNVTLSAVNDDGTAYGVASEAGGQSFLVTTKPDEKPQTTPLAEVAHPPIVIMEGNLGLFRDPETGAISANPIK